VARYIPAEAKVLLQPMRWRITASCFLFGRDSGERGFIWF